MRPTTMPRPSSRAPIASNYLDLAQIMDYWGPRRLNHHTEATTMLYGARECARLLVEEGLDASVARHELHGRAMLDGRARAGARASSATSRTRCTTWWPSRSRSRSAPRAATPCGPRCSTDFGIEIGTSFGPLHGKVWRIGTMGYNARKDAVLVTLAALEAALRAHGVPVPAGGGVDAAQEVYR